MKYDQLVSLLMYAKLVKLLLILLRVSNKKPNSQWLTSALLLNASFIDNLGLMHGKMGIAIYFFYLARQAQNPIYEDYAGELLDEIYNEISTSTSFDFENGLTGIGWGIEYLVQNGFIEADTDEVLEEFDNRVFKELVYNTPRNIGVLNGLLGIGAYFLMRIQNPQSNDENLKTLTNKQALIHLIDELDRRLTDEEIAKLLDSEPGKLPGKQERSTIYTLKNPASDIIRTFDLLWFYPTLIWFLSELHNQNIFNFKVEKMIHRLIEPLTEDINLPKRHSHRLLLAVALEKLHQTSKVATSSNLQAASNYQTILNKLITSISREVLLLELSDNDSTLRHGTSGIVLIYNWLFYFTNNKGFLIEAQFWQTKSFGQKNLDNDYVSDKNKAFGLLEGLAGLGLFNCSIKKHNNITV